jgi:dephospho-CoA kinase
VLTPTGRLDRAALAAKVFASPDERKALEAILHPRIREETALRAMALAETGVAYALYEAALIFEIGGDRDLEGVILVSAAPEVQRARLAKRDGLPPAEIDRRLAAQLPLAEKRAKAKWVLENDGDEAALRAQVVALDATLRKEGT